MKKKLIKFKNFLLNNENKLILVILGMLGFANSCIPVAEYGCPSADFILTGTVKSAETSNGIEGIQVVMAYDTMTTDSNGEFVFHQGGFPEDTEFTVTFSDIDSTLNGHYKDTTIQVQFYAEDLTGGDGNWYEGTASEEIEVELENK